MVVSETGLVVILEHSFILHYSSTPALTTLLSSTSVAISYYYDLESADYLLSVQLVPSSLPI